MFKDKKNLAFLIVVIGIAGWANSLSSKLKHEIEISESLKEQMTKMSSKVVVKTVIKKVPVYLKNGDIALDGAGRAIFALEEVTGSTSTIDEESTLTEAARHQNETIETQSKQRGIYLAYNPLKTTDIGLIYTQDILGPISLGLMTKVDLLSFDPAFYVLAGIRF